MQGTDLYSGFDVFDANDSHVGHVTRAWRRDASQELAFIGVRMSRLLDRTHVVPALNAHVEESRRLVRLPYGHDQVMEAPAVGAHDELDADTAREVYERFSVDASVDTPPHDLLP